MAEFDEGVAAAELRELTGEFRALGGEVRDAVWRYGVVTVRSGDVEEQVFAYEVDGFGASSARGSHSPFTRSQTDLVLVGSYLIADDANLPSLLSLPHLGFLPATDSTYKATRALVLSSRNKWFFRGKMGEGIGGMHIGMCAAVER